MNTTTLRGIFPEPKPVHRKNFLRENVRQLRVMQNVRTTNKEATIQKKKKRSVSVSKITEQVKPPHHTTHTHKIVHKGVQTEKIENYPKFLENGGTIRLARPKSISKSSPKPLQVYERNDRGDAAKLTEKFKSLGLEEKRNYIKENINNMKQKLKKIEETTKDPKQLPSNYQKGKVPKYIEERKEEIKQDVVDSDTIPGLILLPEEERKEYLRVARENYADLIRELNGMPVRNDTLKKRKRKIEIEEELKKIEEVIKVFQKPKVYLKADI